MRMQPTATTGTDRPDFPSCCVLIAASLLLEQNAGLGAPGRSAQAAKPLMNKNITLTAYFINLNGAFCQPFGRAAGAVMKSN
jgi:hypothetical protein